MDAEILLTKTLGVSREYLCTHPEYILTEQEYSQFQTYILLRSRNTPISHILQCKEFFGLDFFVNEKVLTPRPETEMLVEKTLEIIAPLSQSTILDIGTGSGCIALSLAKNLVSSHEIYASDISDDALVVAQKNANLLDIARVHFVRSDLFTNIFLPKNTPEPLIIIANLPYIPTPDILMPEVLNFDPHQALFAGKDGLLLYTKFFQQLHNGRAKQNREYQNFHSCLFEFHPPQQPELEQYILPLFPQHQLDFFADLRGDIRFGILKNSIS